MILCPGAVIDSDNNDIPILSGITFEIFLSFNLGNGFFSRTVIFELKK